MIQWNTVNEKANYFIQTLIAKGLMAETEKYRTDFHHFPLHPIHFGYKDGDKILLKHLIAIYVYCSYDKLQFEFSKTYRLIHQEKDIKDVIKRHCNFYHLARCIKEAIEVFGTEYLYGDNDKVYHGINQQMTFEATSAVIGSPLSTSIDEMVAIQFSNKNGLIVELIPNGDSIYFECNWLSPYSQEQELLMGFGAYGGNIQFQNIKSGLGDDYIHYIPIIRMIESMANGRYFMYHPSDMLKLTNRNRQWIENGQNVKQNKLRSLSLNNKKLFTILICHQLAKNGYIEKNKNLERSKYIHLYDKVMDNAGEYIKSLFDNVCQSKSLLEINMNTMNHSVLKECCNTIIDGDGGYIGYSEWQWLFMNKNKTQIDLNIFPRIIHYFII